jgi:hypothetical protein
MLRRENQSIPSPDLTNNNLLLVIVEVVLGNFQVERSRSTTDTTGNVVVGSVTWAEPSSVVSSLSNGDTTQVRAESQERVPGIRKPTTTHQTPNMTSHSGLLTRSLSCSGSRNVLTSTLLASSISSAVRCRMKTGFPRHLTIKFLPDCQHSVPFRPSQCSAASMRHCLHTQHYTA